MHKGKNRWSSLMLLILYIGLGTRLWIRKVIGFNMEKQKTLKQQIMTAVLNQVKLSIHPTC